MSAILKAFSITNGKTQRKSTKNKEKIHPKRGLPFLGVKDFLSGVYVKFTFRQF